MKLSLWCKKYKNQYLLKEWGGLVSDISDTKTLSEDIDHNSNELAWWECRHCGATYLKTVCAKTSEKTEECTNCKRLKRVAARKEKIEAPKTMVRQITRSLLSSAPEIYLHYYLKQVFPDTQRAVTFDWLGKRSIDIYIPSLKLGIEYDGIYWHEGRSYSDKDKSDLCAQNGVDLIRILECKERDSENSISTIYFNYKKDYSNINEPISAVLLYINNKFNLQVDIDANIYRDIDNITEDSQKLYTKKTLAEKWPETIQYWNYEKNNGIRPQDLLISDTIECHVKCPHCGHEFKIKPRGEQRSMAPCQCERKKENYQKYFDLVQKYYIENGNLDISDNSLEGRRAFDWFKSVCTYWLPTLPEDELAMFEAIGIKPPFRVPNPRVYPMFRERTIEEKRQGFPILSLDDELNPESTL